MQFSAIIGQDQVKSHLITSFSQGRLPHAIMLTGPEGVGKLALASALAQYVNCLQPGETDSCGKCSNCIKISRGIHPDVRYILPIFSKREGGKTYLSEDFFGDFRDRFFKDPYFGFEAWQQVLEGQNKQLMISVHEIRDLKHKVFLKAFEAKYKVVILWNAEKIRVEAANAFLKLLEEPPERTLLIMTCSDPTQLLATINSRTQQIRAGRLTPDAIRTYLSETKGLEESHASEIAGISQGSIGNANLYLQENQQTLNQLYSEWLRMVYTGNYAKIQEEIEKIYKQNKEFQKLFLAFAVKKLRDSLLFHLNLKQLALVTTKEQEFHENFSKVVTPEKVEAMTLHLEKSGRDLAGNAHPQMVFSALSLRLHAILRGS